MRTARARQWPAYRMQFAALREALEAQLAPGEEDLRIRLDVLHAATPDQDPEGYLAELEQLAQLLAERGLLELEVAERRPALDLRGLQPPEPITRILAALEHAPGEPLRAILPHEPVPLYRLLRERGFSCSGAPRADGGFEVLIERA
ncbi:MAG: DUF2249 domain-containing protein [Pseudomonadota bacterium]